MLEGKSGALPLLKKDLIEQSERRRTYALRVAYAAAVFSIFLVYLDRKLQELGTSVSDVAGEGAPIFRALFLIQAGAMLLFLPPIMCGAITQEKENRTLGLLLLTDLKPSEIVLQKFMGRLMPLLTFLFLSLPLVALAYSFGGVTMTDLVTRTTFLFTTALLIGSVGIMCSAYCATLLSALLTTYALVLLFPPVPLAALLPFLVDDMVEGAGARVVTMFLLPAPSVVLTLGFLGLARYFVVRRALVKPGNMTVGLQQALDRLAGKTDEDTQRSRHRKKSALPLADPIAWHEITRRTPSTPTDLVKLGVLIVLPVGLALLAWMAATDGSSGLVPGLVLTLLWGLSVAVAVGKGAGLVAADRASGTLDVLLTTPISGREIVRQRGVGLRRMLCVFALPLAMTYGSRLVVGLGAGGSRIPVGNGVAYLGSAVCAIVVFLSLAYWFAMWMGLRVHKRSRAVSFALSAVGIWTLLPLLAQSVVLEMRLMQGAPFIALLSPAAMPMWSERLLRFSRYDYAVHARVPFGIAGMLASYAVFGALALLLRWRCLRRADYYLGRVEGHGGRVPHETEETLNALVEASDA